MPPALPRAPSTDELVELTEGVELTDAVESTTRVDTIRLAIQGVIPNDGPFIVHRLKTGQPLPASAVEAMLVLTGEGFAPVAPFHPRTSALWAARWKTAIAHHATRALRFLDSLSHV